MFPTFLGRDLFIQYPTAVVAVIFLILVRRNAHDLLKIAVKGRNILISDSQGNLCHGIIGEIEQFIGFLDSHHRQIFTRRHIQIFLEPAAQLGFTQRTDGSKFFPGDRIHIVQTNMLDCRHDLLQSNHHRTDIAFLFRVCSCNQEKQ